MSARRSLLLVIIAVICYLLTFFLFSKFNLASRWNFSIDRNAAIAKAKTAAELLGYEIQNSGTMVSAKYYRTLEYYLAKPEILPAAKLLTGQKARVTFSDYKTGRRLFFDINTRGQFVGFSHRSDVTPAASAPRSQTTQITT